MFTLASITVRVSFWLHLRQQVVWLFNEVLLFVTINCYKVSAPFLRSIPTVHFVGSKSLKLIADLYYIGVTQVNCAAEAAAELYCLELRCVVTELISQRTALRRKRKRPADTDSIN